MPSASSLPCCSCPAVSDASRIRLGEIFLAAGLMTLLVSLIKGQSPGRPACVHLSELRSRAHRCLLWESLQERVGDVVLVPRTSSPMPRSTGVILGSAASNRFTGQMRRAVLIVGRRS